MRIALSQMAAEELGAPIEKVSVVDADTALTPDHGGTGGSTGIPRGGVEIRRAAATARQAILHMAPGSVMGGGRLYLKVDPQAPLRDPMSYKVVGKPVLRTD